MPDNPPVMMAVLVMLSCLFCRCFAAYALINAQVSTAAQVLSFCAGR
jgi:hypothetical protein